MQFRDVSERVFDVIRSELLAVSRTDKLVETIKGQHATYGATVLVRDGSRCMVVVDNPTGLDRFLAVQAFLDDSTTTRASGRA